MGLTSQLNRKYRSMIARGIYPVCHLCGKPITKQNEISQDHLICVSNNGPTIIENLCSAHKVCNNRRGNMTLQQWFDRQRG